MAHKDPNRLEALVHMRQELLHGIDSIDHAQQLANTVGTPAAKANAPRPS